MANDPLADHIALQDLMLRYTVGLDERRFDLYRSCFTEDVEVLGFRPEPLRGRDALLDFVKTALGPYAATQHLIGPPFVTLNGNAAHARTALQGLHYLKQPESGALILWAIYETDFVRAEDEWKIKKHHLAQRDEDILNGSTLAVRFGKPLAEVHWKHRAAAL